MIQAHWGQVAPYNRTTNLISVPETAGIYCLLVQHRNGSYGLCYVGQADNLRERLRDHQQLLEPNEGIRTYLSQYVLKAVWIQVPVAEDRDAIELYLYNTYKPSLNKQTPPGNKMLAVTVCW